MIEVIRGNGPYEKQTARTEMLRPLILTAIFAAVVCVYAALLYLEAALVGEAFGYGLLAIAALVLLKPRYVGGSVTIQPRPLAAGWRWVWLAVLAIGALFSYLTASGAWPWAWEVNASRLWIITPLGSTSLPQNWQAARLGLAAVIPVAAIPAGIELLTRLLSEIGYPNLANSVRAHAGILKRRRWTTPVAAEQPAGAPADGAQPVVWER